jgi:hypothetical protein
MIILPIITYWILALPVKSNKGFRVKIMNVHNSKERNHFWEAYRGCVGENRVHPDRLPSASSSSHADTLSKKE